MSTSRSDDTQTPDEREWEAQETARLQQRNTPQRSGPPAPSAYETIAALLAEPDVPPPPSNLAYVLATRAFDAWLNLEAPAGAMAWPVTLAVAAALGLVAVAIGRSGPAASLAYALALGWARPPIPPPTAAGSAASAVPSEYGSRP